MTCSFLDTLSDAIFDRLVSGEMPDDVRHHIQQCDSCLQQVEALKSFMALTVRYLYRVTCPSPDTLALFIHAPDQISDEEQIYVREHLEICMECHSEYEMLVEMMGLPLTLPPAVNIGATLRTIVARLRPPTSHNISAAPMALRGTALLPEGLVYETDDVLIVLDLERESTATFSLSGFLSSKDGNEIAFEGLEVRLRKNGSVLQTTVVDEFDTFVFSNVPPGTYHLEIDCADARILIETVEVA